MKPATILSLPQRKSVELSAALASDIETSARKAKPSITDDELEQLLTGFETIGRDAAQRSGKARVEVESSKPRAALARQLERVDASLSAVAAAQPGDAQRKAVAELEEVARTIWVCLEYHGLERGWQDSVATNPMAFRSALASAMRAAGPGPNQMAELHREQECAERGRVARGVAKLAHELFPMQDPPPGFSGFAARAIAEAVDDTDEG